MTSGGRYRKFLWLLAPTILFPSFVCAQVAQFVFITSPQSVEVNVISEVITLQTQDSSGASAPTTETLDLEFISTSATGEFLGSTGNPATKTMNTNTSNRNIFYRDSSTGVFDLTINAKGRTSGSIFSATQAINIVATNSGGGGVSTSTATTTSSSVTTTQAHRSTEGSISAHSSYLNLSDYQKIAPVKISAGRDRIALVGVPLEFQAEADGYDGNASYIWSFGDGYTDHGKSVFHEYEYPGNYVVVLSSNSPNGQAISRVNVFVSEPQIYIAESNPEFISVKNSSKQETNLYGWHVSVNDKSFEFPRDTIVPAGAIIKFSSKFTRLFPLNKNQVVLGTFKEKYKADLNTLNIEIKDKSKDLDVIYAQAIKIKQELSLLADKQNNFPEFKNPNDPDRTEHGDNLASTLNPFLDKNGKDSSGPEGQNNWLNKIRLFLFQKR